MARDIYTKEERLVLGALSGISPDMREARQKEPFIFLEMVALQLTSSTGESWDIKRVLMTLLPILFAAGDGFLEEG